MADSPILQIPLLSTSQAAKEQTINQMVSFLERSMNDARNLSLSAGNVSLTPTDFARYFMWRLTGVVSGRTITVPAQKRLFVVENLTGGFTVLLNRGASSLTIPVGGVLVVYCDGTNLISVADSTVMGGEGGSVTAFVSLIDTFSTYAGQAGKLVMVNEDEDGLITGTLDLGELGDVNLTGIADGFTLIWDADSSTWVVTATAGSSSGSNAIKNPVDLATTLPLSIDDDLIVGNSLDLIPLEEDMRVLVKDQVDELQNGIYVITDTTPVRAADANSSGDFFEGTLIYVIRGLENGGKLFMQSEPAPPGGIVPGSSPTTFELFGLGNLSALGDVNVTGVADGEALIWDALTSKWVPGTAGASYPDMTGNAGKVLTVNEDEDGVEWGEGGAGSGIPVLSVFAGGEVAANEVLFRWVVPEGITFTLPAGLTGSKFTAGVASSAPTTLTIYKGVSSIGTVVFNTSDTGTVTFASGVVFNENDVLSISGGATPDPDLADISMSFKGA